MTARRFQRTVEDFVCERCGTLNTGDGYTNHCRECLYSKHVDVHPGDRAASCGGLMRPVDVLRGGGRWKLVHECERCGFRRANRLRDEETDALIGTMRRLADSAWEIAVDDRPLDGRTLDDRRRPALDNGRASKQAS